MNGGETHPLPEPQTGGDDRRTRRACAAWKAAEIVVLLLAGVVMLIRHGAGFLCFGSIGLLIGLAIARALACFLREPLPRRKASFALVVLLAGLGIGWIYYETTPRVLFRHYVCDPLPASLRILQCEHQGDRDPAVYFHFALSPSDLDLLLRSRAYMNDPNMHGPTFRLPSWWKPESLTDPTMYEWRNHADTPTEEAWLWVSEDKTEAYFAHWTF